MKKYNDKLDPRNFDKTSDGFIVVRRMAGRRAVAYRPRGNRHECDGNGPGWKVWMLIEGRPVLSYDEHGYRLRDNAGSLARSVERKLAKSQPGPGEYDREREKALKDSISEQARQLIEQCWEQRHEMQAQYCQMVAAQHQLEPDAAEPAGLRLEHLAAKAVVA